MPNYHTKNWEDRFFDQKNLANKRSCNAGALAKYFIAF